MTSFLELMNEVVDEGAFGTIVGGIVNNDNDLARRLKRIANRVIKEYAEKFPWRELWRIGTITLVEGQSSYALPADFNYHHMYTYWKQSDTTPLVILNPIELAYLNAESVDVTPTSQFYIQGMADSKLFIRPTPTAAEAGTTVTFHYQGRRPIRPQTWVTGLTVASGDYCFYNGNYYTAASAGTTSSTAPTHTSGSASDGGVTWDFYSGAYDSFQADTDEINLNESIFTQGVLERLSATTGQVVAPQFEARLVAEWSRQAPAETISVVSASSAFTYAQNGKVTFSTGH